MEEAESSRSPQALASLPRELMGCERWGLGRRLVDGARRPPPLSLPRREEEKEKLLEWPDLAWGVDARGFLACVGMVWLLLGAGRRTGRHSRENDALPALTGRVTGASRLEGVLPRLEGALPLLVAQFGLPVACLPEKVPPPPRVGLALGGDAPTNEFSPFLRVSTA